MGLETIFDAVAALSVTTPDITPTVYNFDAIPNRVDAEMLPVRLLMPLQDRNAAGSAFTFIALGKTARAERRIVDLLLLRSLAQSTNIKAPIEDLVQYVDAYEAAVRSNRGLTANAAITGLDVALGRFEFGGVEYFGAEMTLTIYEALSG
ncbi:MAG TPA: hypothetical protein PLD57_14740 [Aggregatilineales bacterium]|nr:hypothetical protein [Aggregatilineales bacterium]HPV08326.1 hypothetical protein [Aggregatilineales bacterium]HQE18928.1 hypothetical protein [Aggregatilineales bacterium]